MVRMILYTCVHKLSNQTLQTQHHEREEATNNFQQVRLLKIAMMEVYAKSNLYRVF